MANTIKLRRGTTAPAAASFAVGEPAWDQNLGILYIKNAAGTMVQINAANLDYGLVTDTVAGSFDYGTVP